MPYSPTNILPWPFSLLLTSGFLLSCFFSYLFLLVFYFLFFFFLILSYFSSLLFLFFLIFLISYFSPFFFQAFSCLFVFMWMHYPGCSTLPNLFLLLCGCATPAAPLSFSFSCLSVFSLLSFCLSHFFSAFSSVCFFKLWMTTPTVPLFSFFLLVSLLFLFLLNCSCCPQLCSQTLPHRSFYFSSVKVPFYSSKTVSGCLRAYTRSTSLLSIHLLYAKCFSSAWSNHLS